MKNSSGTPKWNIPYSTGAALKDTTIGYKKVIWVIAKTVNADGQTWYKTKDNKWIYSGDLKRAYCVSYDANGGSDAPDNQYFSGSSIKLSSEAPTKFGYAFVGWSTTKDGMVEYMPGSTYAKTKSVKLYAVWGE